MLQADFSHVEVRAVVGKRMLNEFIRVPWAIYRDDAHWVPPLMMERKDALADSNPFFQHAEWQAWIAYRGDNPVGRISAQIDRLFLEKHDAHCGFFGLVEAENNPAVFAALFEAAETWLKHRGMQRILGPFNLGINQDVGVLVEGFDSPPFIMMGHARRYYGSALEALGFQPAQDLLAYEVNATSFGMPERMRQLLFRQGHRVNERRFNRKNRDSELEIMRDIFNDAWSNNWGFVPFTQAEFQAVGKDLLKLIPDDFIRIAEVNDEPAAFIAMLPNINEAITDLDGRLLPFGWAKLLWRLKVRCPKSARVVLMGVRQKFQHTRLGPALAFLIIDGLEQPARKKGIERAELSWVLEQNRPMRNVIEQTGGKITKRYRMYSKDLA